VLGSNGEYPALSSKEKVQVLETVAKAFEQQRSSFKTYAGARYHFT
jgi:dihydrodipicolinate synthase/N-acetylneuraminate lyase